jgi:hypothetical protein
VYRSSFGPICISKFDLILDELTSDKRSICTQIFAHPFTYDHRTLKTRLPVRSALFKQRTGGLVVRWVTTSEYPLLYVFGFLFFQMPKEHHPAVLS